MMCDEPAGVTGGLGLGSLAGMGVDAAMSKAGRRVLFWGVCIPLLPFAVWGVFGWWTIALAALAAAGSAAGLVVMRVMHRHVLVVAPPSLQHRVALPRNLAITRKRRQALPAPATAIEPSRVIPARVHHTAGEVAE